MVHRLCLEAETEKVSSIKHYVHSIFLFLKFLHFNMQHVRHLLQKGPVIIHKKGLEFLDPAKLLQEMIAPFAFMPIQTKKQEQEILLVQELFFTNQEQ